MVKFISFFIALFIWLNFLTLPVSAATNSKDVTIVNPIRGKDFWSHPYDLLETPKKQYELISKNNIAATWLIRFDALNDEAVSSFLKTFNPKQEIGVFLEITPSLTQAAGVTYNPSANWHYSTIPQLAPTHTN